MTASLPPCGGMLAMVQLVMAILFKKFDRAAQIRRRDRYILRHCEARSDEAIQFLCVASGLLRGACHRAARSLSSGAHSRDPLARPLARKDAKFRPSQIKKLTQRDYFARSCP